MTQTGAARGRSARTSPASAAEPVQTPARRAPRALRGADRTRWRGWLFVLPALAVYGFFVLRPLLTTMQYSLYRWDGIGPSQWVGLDNYRTVLTDPDLLEIILHAFVLIIFFSFVPVCLGLLVASLIHRVSKGPLGAAARTILFLPQIIPLVAAGIAWSWVLSTTGIVNQVLNSVGLDRYSRAWLGEFDTALPAVGVIGAWVLLGLCTILLVTGMSKIDPALYEAARIDGAGSVREFFAVTLPSLRREVGICLTVTVIAALASFDIVYISTSGGPGTATTVPGLEIYRLAFAQRQVGLASALAVVLMLLVLVCVLPIQRLSREGK
ncbi:carbohydrate ABC transporter permease [Streptomyces sp. RP5T]|uniref:carbohydrate ABC transporter permease n=1 Tax=Streptomyces sp. RP5T TaxID=2490848 RepID=UPI0021AD9F98|nr:sugar ABC transporter permease [Streptomyces sp. RP5T]